MVWRFESEKEKGERTFREVVKLAENSPVGVFIEEILSVCAKHGFSIGHEDGHGGFEIHPHDESLAEWLREAHALVEEES